MDAFGNVQIVPLNLPQSINQFQIYSRISRNYSYSFLFESLTGPKSLSEMSVMGFDPVVVLRTYFDRVEITLRDNDGGEIVITTDNPFKSLRFILHASAGCSNMQDLKKSLSGSHAHDTDAACNDSVCNADDRADSNADDASCLMDNYRYVGGAVGMVNYDTIRVIEDVPDSNCADPLLMEFGIYNDGILYDNKTHKPFYFYRGNDRFDELICDDLFAINDDDDDDDDDDGDAKNSDQFYAGRTSPNMDKEQFSNMVMQAKKYIQRGDIFQVVLSRRFGFDTCGDTLALYNVLRDLNPSPYMYHLKHAGRITIGASPEMLVRITGDMVETFPIAGTRKITGDKSHDDALAKELLSSQKELAEHTMLVDLGRNDIGRVCRFGTVRPASLMEIKQFSHVQHIVTHLTGRLDDGNDMFDAFEAVFPAGTVSGAPKVRAMEIIDELESDARGPYAGAVGYFSYNGCCDFAIAIRSIFINGNRGFVQSGAGIVHDSVPEYEFKETEHKANAMLQALREASAKK